MGRPGNFDVARPHDSSSVFDTGMPKDVSPYQPRVAVSVEIQPKSVFKPRRMQRQPRQINGAKWGQTALKSIFGGEENVITNYMAQRMLGIVEGSESSDRRMDQSMQSVGNGNLMDFREPIATSDATSTVQSSSPSDVSMGSGGARPTPGEVADLTNLSLGEVPLGINIAPPENQPSGFNPESQETPDDDVVMDAVAEVETQPTEAATQSGMMIPPPPPPPPIVQQTDAGLATIKQRDRTAGSKRTPVERFLNRFDPTDLQSVKLKKAIVETNPVVQSSDNPLLAAIRAGVKLKKAAQSKPVQKKAEVSDPMMDALKAAMSKRRQAVAKSDNDSGEWV